MANLTYNHLIKAINVSYKRKEKIVKQKIFPGIEEFVNILYSLRYIIGYTYVGQMYMNIILKYDMYNNPLLNIRTVKNYHPIKIIHNRDIERYKRNNRSSILIIKKCAEKSINTSENILLRVIPAIEKNLHIGGLVIAIIK